MTVQFRTDSSVSRTGFRALLRFTYGHAAGCGGNIDLRTASSSSLRSVDADNNGLYENDLNCHWLVMGREAKNVRLAFSSFDVESNVTDETNATMCTDYVEVRDGDGPYSPLVGRYCGTNAPDVITTSANFLWIKFFSDGAIGRAGFVATLTNVDPVCGSHVPINATNTTQVGIFKTIHLPLG